MDQIEELTPASYSLDPRYVYPDPLCGENVQAGRGIFELDKKTVKGVMELAKQPAYIKPQLKKAIEQGPTTGSAMSRLDVIEDRDKVAGDLFEHWIYWGEIERDDLEAAGVELPEDDLDVVSACVEMVNNVVVRAYLNPLADGALPYDFFPWERVPGSCQGYGVPYLMRSQQRVINAAWRMILDNAGVSSGPQIIMKAGAVTPADKQWTLTPRKIWYATDDVEDVNKVFQTFEFDSHQAELAAIIELAEKLSDAETAVPQMTQGERGSAPETVGGMQMLMNSANVVLRRLVKNFDDTITKPHVRRYYDYLMEYGDDDSMKGDFQVVALGSSSLVVRDIENQAITNMLALGTNPAYAPLINLKKLFEKALKAQHIDPVDVMNSDAEIQANLQRAAQSQQQDPRIAAAEMRAEADKLRTQSQEKVATETLQVKQNQAALEHQRAMDQLAAQERIETMKMAQKTSMTFEQIRAQLAAVGIKERAKADLAAMDMHVQAATGQGG
jgi:ribosomal protein L29